MFAKALQRVLGGGELTSVMAVSGRSRTVAHVVLDYDGDLIDVTGFRTPEDLEAEAENYGADFIELKPYDPRDWLERHERGTSQPEQWTGKWGAHYPEPEQETEKWASVVARNLGLLPDAQTQASYSQIASVLLRAAEALEAKPEVARHPHAYEWHDPHTEHYSTPVVAHEPPIPPSPKDINEQAAGVGVATYEQFAKHYGTIKPGTKGPTVIYPYHGKLAEAQKLVKDHGYEVYYAGGKYGRPDLAKKNYNTKHLMIYDPSPESGGDFKDRDYTDTWRQIHELAHALTYPEINKLYGEGRRIGKLGTHRTMHEAQRAIHWEWLAAHMQRELSKKFGIHISDTEFNRELNTIMHDAVHRAVTGKFTEPSDEGFHPHAHKIPLEVALKLLQDEAKRLGLKSRHELTTTIPRKVAAKLAASNKAKGLNWMNPSSWPQTMKHGDFAHDFRALLQDHDFDSPEYDIVQIRLADVVIPSVDDDDDRHFNPDTGEPSTAYMDGLIEAMRNGEPMPPIVVGNVDARSGKPWGWPYDGRHRLNAAKALGLKFVPAIDVTGRGEDAT